MTRVDEGLRENEARVIKWFHISRAKKQEMEKRLGHEQGCSLRK